jgi:hypothetical protein
MLLQSKECDLITLYDTHRRQPTCGAVEYRMARYAGFVGPVLAKSFNLAERFLVADLAQINRDKMPTVFLVSVCHLYVTIL